jgi:hypothetical protein
MTFSIIVPNANQSPGLFPAQNNTNFQRLKDIINNEHLFSDASIPNQGFHKQVTLINKSAAPVGLPTGGNGIVFSINDADGQSQLHWYNGIGDYPLTPPEKLYPLKLTGVANVVANGTHIILPDPGYRYAGTVFAIIQGSGIYSCYTIVKSGPPVGANTGLRISLVQAGGASAPSVLFTGNDLLVKNESSSLSRDIVWSMIYNRID